MLTTGIERVSQDGRFTLQRTVNSGLLNEDWGKDEVYAVVDIEGSGTYRTNTITAYF